MASKLDQLRAMTVIVADTGDIEAVRRLKPQDCTTNPSLLLKAVEMPAYAGLFDESLAWGRRQGGAREAVIAAMCDRLAVAFGTELAGIVPGRVSTEVDADLSFDTPAMVETARAIIGAYAARGVGRERILIKLASTWEGIQAARALQHEGIRCNMTLLLAFCQAVACGDAGAQLISPFVGRIYDWHKKAAGSAWDEAANAGVNDPGVRSVTQIYRYYKKFGVGTEVMGASFRSIGQIRALAGCDLLTISPELLAELAASQAPLAHALDDTLAGAHDMPRVVLDEPAFRFALNEAAMATEKLAEGIRAFAADAVKLEKLMET